MRSNEAGNRHLGVKVSRAGAKPPQGGDVGGSDSPSNWVLDQHSTPPGAKAPAANADGQAKRAAGVAGAASPARAEHMPSKTPLALRDAAGPYAVPPPSAPAASPTSPSQPP